MGIRWAGGAQLKKLFVLLILAIGSLILTGCGDPDPTGTWVGSVGMFTSKIDVNSDKTAVAEGRTYQWQMVSDNTIEFAGEGNLKGVKMQLGSDGKSAVATGTNGFTITFNRL